MAAPSASTERAVLSPAPMDAALAPSVPKPPKTTLARERFMALHMRFVRMRPEAPTRAPEMMRIMLFRMNPAAEAASPE